MQKLKKLQSGLDIYPTSVPAFSTIATGFWIAQYGLLNTFSGLVIYSNTAPRKDTKKPRIDNAGECLVYAKLKNGVPVIAVNAGYNLSFIKNEIADFRKINVANKGSQFRSRDFYPEAVLRIINKDPEILLDKLDIGLIPDVPINRIAFTDGYGNIKTTIRRSQLNYKPGEKIKIKIGTSMRVAYFSDGTFTVHEGELALAKGSAGGNNGFMEIFFRGGSAWLLFGKPKVEEEIFFEKSPV
jgi:hypothetical protein